MDPTQDFEEFILSHPTYYHITQSEIFLQLLDFLCSDARSAVGIYKNFDKIEPQELDQMVEILVKLGLVKKVFTKNTTSFYCTIDAKILLEKVKNVKKTYG